MEELDGLLERDLELGVLDAAAASAAGGRGRVVVLEGAAGIGKSRLLRAARARSRPQTVLTGQGLEMEADYPFGVVRQLFDPVIRAAPASKRDRIFAGAARAARHLFEPEVEVAVPPEQASFAVLHGLYWLVAGLTDAGPVTLVVDDVHWLDAPSRRFLEFLLPRVAELPLLVLLAMRPAADKGASALLDGLAGEDADVLRLQPLSEAGVESLIAARLGEVPTEEMVAACAEVTGGNAFYLTALLGEIARAASGMSSESVAAITRLGPRTVASAAIRRLGRGQADAIALAGALAVLGDGAQLDVVAEMAGLEGAEARVAVDALTTAEVLADDPELRFSHPILRAAFAEDMGARRLAEAHGRAAAILADRGVGEERIAVHLLMSDPAGNDETVETLRRVARSARADGAAETAVNLLARALREPPSAERRAEVMLELGSVEVMSMRPEGVDRLIEAFEAVSDVPSQVAAAVPALMYLLVAHRVDDALRMLDRVDESGDVASSRLLDARFASMAIFAIPNGYSLSRPRIESHADLREPTTLADRLILCQAALQRAWSYNDSSAASALAARALAGLDVGRDPAFMATDFAAAAYALTFAERITEAEALISAIIERARRWGSSWDYGQAIYQRAVLAWACGAIDDAETDARESLEVALPGGMVMAMLTTTSTVVSALIERGELQDAWDALARVGCADGPVADVPAFILVLAARGRLRLAGGDATGALDDLAEAGRRCAVSELHNPGLVPWRASAAAAQLMLGDRTGAIALAADELAVARRWGTPGAVGAAERLAGVAAGGEEGIERLQRARELLARSSARLEHARCLVDLGAALRRVNRRTEAREPLRAGAELAQRCGAIVLQQRAVDELAATGARLRRAALSGPDSLTASERRVVNLAAEGLTNTEIAQALFVTRKTVEKHLGSAYSKLDINSRSQLPRALTR